MLVIKCTLNIFLIASADICAPPPLPPPPKKKKIECVVSVSV